MAFYSVFPLWVRVATVFLTALSTIACSRTVSCAKCFSAELVN
jgi:hypothetical protein